MSEDRPNVANVYNIVLLSSEARGKTGKKTASIPVVGMGDGGSTE